MHEAIYNFNSQHRPQYPGAKDTYRNIQFTVDLNKLTWTAQLP